MDKMHNYGLARFDKESGKINTSMTAIGRGVIQLWALQNTRENEACVIVDVDERMVFAEYVGTDDGLPDVRKNPKDFDKIQKNLKEVKDSGICVATKLPMELHYDAFSIIPSVEPFSNEILKLVIILINAKSLEDFLIRVSLHSLDGIIKFIKGIDNAIAYFNESLQKQFDTSMSSKESIKEYNEFVANEDKQLTHKRLVEYFVDGFIENSSDVRKMGVCLGLTYEQFR